MKHIPHSGGLHNVDMSCIAFRRHIAQVHATDVALLLLGASALLGLPWSWAVMCVVAPLCEELIFRWGLQETLLRWRMNPLVANGLTAMIFALAHGVFRAWALAPWVLVPALFLGAVYQQGRAHGARVAVRRCVLWHSAFNVVYMLLAQGGVSGFGS